MLCSDGAAARHEDWLVLERASPLLPALSVPLTMSIIIPSLVHKGDEYTPEGAAARGSMIAAGVGLLRAILCVAIHLYWKR